MYVFKEYILQVILNKIDALFFIETKIWQLIIVISFVYFSRQIATKCVSLIEEIMRQSH